MQRLVGIQPVLAGVRSADLLVKDVSE
jgi:hypothetical protein